MAQPLDAMIGPLEDALRGIDDQIKIIENWAAERGLEPRDMMDMHGNRLLGPLLVGKANALLALTMIRKE